MRSREATAALKRCLRKVGCANCRTLCCHLLQTLHVHSWVLGGSCGPALDVLLCQLENACDHASGSLVD
eukprot:8319430-Alexandrium_andersonii.AAC.1